MDWTKSHSLSVISWVGLLAPETRAAMAALRAELRREPYDLVLDRFPWGFEWVKLPWMETPLQVEW